ncbi:MAG TPA: S49 family peptidase [Candidatus Azoamicus sp. MARI]
MQNNCNLDKTFIKEFLCDSLIERRRSRRWSIFFKFIFLLFFLFLFSVIFYNNKKIEHVAVVNISGLISDNSYTNAKCIIMSLDEAFADKKSKAVILKINSPGGTPVQSNIIYNHIKKLRQIYSSKPIYAVIEDIGTSGAYLIALAAEKIYCNPYSIVGSIGVVISSFGFSNAINKLGIERRIYKAGKNKVIMDPFLEKSLDDEKMLQHDLDIMHENFINLVKQNRSDNLMLFDEHDVFSGKFWVGIEALSVGLIDGFSDIYSLSSDIIKIPLLIEYKHDQNILNVFARSIKN